ncbi:serine hydrolase [Mesorhizobium sp. J428]|uniref:serine hydrolase domain-containing protein n=1 Tax=Mesorhizobium sp. J428 TaxID=2898440 RepID=UPI002151D87E|nr:serine hydrolase [Mesorhizobium sp. J428]MCR5858979.1 serine hydrolase [Mesorhizobium sp. J428]
MTAIPFTRQNITLSNWREAPYHRWSFANVSEFVPTATITSGIESNAGSPGASRLETMTLTRPDGTQVPAAEHLALAHGDCFVAMRNGNVVAEWNAPHGSTVRPHLIFSISKSVTGMLAGIAVGDGKLDPSAPVSNYVQVPAGSAYETATVRHLFDMTVSLGFVEDYLDLEGDFDRYRRSMLWNPERSGTKPESMEAVLIGLPKADGPHGKVFAYASPNTDMLGIVIERATGIRLHEYNARPALDADGRSWACLCHRRSHWCGPCRRRNVRDGTRPGAFWPARARWRPSRRTAGHSRRLDRRYAQERRPAGLDRRKFFRLLPGRTLQVVLGTSSARRMTTSREKVSTGSAF